MADLTPDEQNALREITIIKNAADAALVLSDEVGRLRAEVGGLTSKLDAALAVIVENGDIDGSHHKQWVLDQVVRTLTGDGYRAWVEAYCAGEDGPDTYAWDEGVAP